MTELEALLGGIASEPLEETRWLVLADWLDENDDVRRGELLRLHRKLLATCCEPDAHPERKVWQARVVELIAAGARPCVQQRTLTLPGGVSMTLSYIPPGSFLMGSNHSKGSDGELPLHRVTLTKGFYLGVHPVTQTQWEAAMGNNPSHFEGANRPVEGVSWDDCQEFCGKVGSRQERGVKVELPTEAEWEYACRAGTTSEYHFGDLMNTDLANYNGRYSWNDSPKGKLRKTTTDVGSFPPNPWGLFDMHGNVHDWCQDAYDENFYQSSPTQDPRCDCTQANDRVLRGGSWFLDPQHCRAAYRGLDEPARRSYGIGFRVCFRLV